MVYMDRTPELIHLCTSYPPLSSTKRKKAIPDHNSQSEALARAYVAEAYSILKHIETLSALLTSARRPYLNVDVSQAAYTRQARTFDFSSSNAFSGLKTLTNEERDQIDLQTRMILVKCADRVREMEALERRRQEAIASQSNPLSRLLPARLLVSSDPSKDLVAAHRTNITWYLTRRLADVSQTQKEMQEERIKRQVERAKTLGSSSAATYESEKLQTRQASLRASESGWGSSLGAFILGSNLTSEVHEYKPPPPASDDEEEEDLELTPGQILLFEQENAAILRSVEDTLAAVKLAESRLMDISALQTELIVQLTKQSEQIDQLYDDAITAQGEVERGHDQLKQARERAKESRKWLLLFILGATAAMLFLHWYD